MNIGTLLITCKDLSGAKRWLRRALAIEEGLLDPDHPDLALCLKPGRGSVSSAPCVLSKSRWATSTGTRCGSAGDWKICLFSGKIGS